MFQVDVTNLYGGRSLQAVGLNANGDEARAIEPTLLIDADTFTLVTDPQFGGVQGATFLKEGVQVAFVRNFNSIVKLPAEAN